MKMKQSKKSGARWKVMLLKTNTLELRKQIKLMLSTVCDNVYFEQNNMPNLYPYIVFSLTQIAEDCGRKDYQLEVNIVDLGKSTERVELFADKLQDIFNGYLFSNDKISFVTYIGQRNTIIEQNKEIKRRRLTFDLGIYSKEVEK